MGTNPDVAAAATATDHATSDAVPAATRRLADELAAMDRAGELAAPPPGTGRTRQRWWLLAAVAARDLGLGRLVEGHLDAVAIRLEAGRGPGRGRSGVFAARGPGSTVTATPRADGWRLSGTRRYASGARVLDRALVDVDAPDGPRLLDVDLRAPGVRTVPGTWEALGMASTDTVTVTFDEVDVPRDHAVGGPGFYTGRPGFGHGGAGVAACWWGGAIGVVASLVDAAAARDGGERRSHAVAAAIVVRDLGELLAAAAADLDRDPDDATRAHERASTVRWSVHRGCQEVLAHAWAAGGTAAVAADGVHAQRLADLATYLTQFGGQSTLDVVDPRRLVVDLPGTRS